MNKKALWAVAAIIPLAAAGLTVSRSPTETAVPREHRVLMKFDEESGRVMFEPERLDIRSGDRVTWVQVDRDNGHNVVAYPDGVPEGTELFESPMLKEEGQRWSMVFDKPGSYKYHCHPHEGVGMRAMIVVDRESRPEELRRAMPGDHMHHSASDDEHGPGRRHGAAGRPHRHDRL